MLAQIIRDDIEVAPGFCDAEHLQEKITWRDVVRNDVLESVPFWKKGTILDFPDCFWLVRQGCAIPADEACRLRAGMSPEKMAAAQYAHERLTRGIEPDDFDKYDKGQILGYNPDGSYIPGPNFADLQAELIALEHTDEDDV